MILDKTTHKKEGKNKTTLKIFCNVLKIRAIILLEKCLRYQSMLYICKTIKQKEIMKKTSNIAIESKLSKLVDNKLINKSSIVYGWIKEIQSGKSKFRPVYSQGSSWKNSTLFDRRMEFTKVLNLLKIEFVQGNDAPQGGQTGAFLNIITKVKQLEVSK